MNFLGGNFPIAKCRLTDVIVAEPIWRVAALKSGEGPIAPIPLPMLAIALFKTVLVFIFLTCIIVIYTLNTAKQFLLSSIKNPL